MAALFFAAGWFLLQGTAFVTRAGPVSQADVQYVICRLVANSVYQLSGTTALTGLCTIV